MLKRLSFSAVALLSSIGAALAGGAFNQFPITGVPANTVCLSFGNNGVCNQFAPAGPTQPSGVEVIPGDTGLSGGQNPQTTVTPSVLLGSLNARVNRIIGGDFSTNLWQRGTTPVSAASPTTYVMAADRWFAISASNVMTITKQTPASSAANYNGMNGFYSTMRVARPSGTPSGSSCVGQILDQKQSADLIGKNAVLTFYGYAPTTFSASNQQISVAIGYYTATDSATPGTNTATAALSVSGQASGITGYTAATAGPVLNTTGSLASGVETIGLTQTPTLYGVYAPIPVTNAAGTVVTGVVVSFCATPTLTTTVSTDYFELSGVQLQAMPSTVTVELPNGVTTPTGFERRTAAVEAALQYWYSTAFTEPAASISIAPSGQGASTTTCILSIPFPYPMREVPTFSAAGTALGTGTWTVTHVVTNTALATPFLAATTGGSTTNMGNLTATVASGLTAGQTCTLTGAAGGSILVFSAEP